MNTEKATTDRKKLDRRFVEEVHLRCALDNVADLQFGTLAKQAQDAVIREALAESSMNIVEVLAWYRKHNSLATLEDAKAYVASITQQ